MKLYDNTTENGQNYRNPVLYMDYSDPENLTPMFFKAVLDGGVLNVPPRDSGEVLR